MRVLSAAMAFSLSGSLAVAQQNTYWVISQGFKSCAHTLSNPALERDGSEWSFGYWSGLNAANTSGGHVGEKSDIEAIWGEIKKICEAEPSTKLVDAAERVYVIFRQSGK
jgi:hypothetical protein